MTKLTLQQLKLLQKALASALDKERVRLETERRFLIATQKVGIPSALQTEISLKNDEILTALTSSWRVG